MNRDLFGGELPDEPATKRTRAGRVRVDLAHPAQVGSGPAGETCRTCARWEQKVETPADALAQWPPEGGAEQAAVKLKQALRGDEHLATCALPTAHPPEPQPLKGGNHERENAETKAIDSAADNERRTWIYVERTNSTPPICLSSPSTAQPATSDEVSQQPPKGGDATRPSTEVHAPLATAETDITMPIAGKPRCDNGGRASVEEHARAGEGDVELGDGWKIGGVERCVVCGRGVALRDPKNRPRHRHCAES